MSWRRAPPGMKALDTWHATRDDPGRREACGGAGYLSENLLAGLKADTDVFTTFEGDNTVLLQLVAKGLLTSTGATSRTSARWPRRGSSRSSWWAR